MDEGSSVGCSVNLYVGVCRGVHGWCCPIPSACSPCSRNSRTHHEGHPCRRSEPMSCLDNPLVTGAPHGLWITHTAFHWCAMVCTHPAFNAGGPPHQRHTTTCFAVVAMRHIPHASTGSLSEQRAWARNACIRGGIGPPLAGGLVITCGNPGLTCNGLDTWSYQISPGQRSGWHT